MDNDHLPNQILEHLFLGSAIAFQNPDLLLSLGIKHVIDLSRQPGLPEVEEFSYSKLDVKDRDTDIVRFFRQTHELIYAARERGKEGVLVHCSYGISRSATIVLSYLVALHDMTLQYSSIFWT